MKKIFIAVMVLILSTNVKSQILSTLPDAAATNNTHFAGVEIVGGVKTTHKYSMASLATLLGAGTSVNIGNTNLVLPTSGVTRQFNLLTGNFELYKVGNFYGLYGMGSSDTLFRFSNSSCFFNRSILMQTTSSILNMNDVSLAMVNGSKSAIFSKDSVLIDNGTYRMVMDIPNKVFGILDHETIGDATTNIIAGFKILPSSGNGSIKLKGTFNYINITPYVGDGTVRNFIMPPRSGEVALAGDGILPNIVFASGAGTGATIVFQDGDDRSGVIEFQTGTGCLAGNLIFRITYSQPFVTNTRVVLMPKTTGSAVAMSASAIYIGDDQTSYFDVSCGGSPGVALADNTQYYFTYVVMK